jgi:hypothetical protein
VLSTDLGLAVEVRVTNSLGEVRVLDRIHFGRAELTALYLRLNAELAKGK